MKIITHDDDGFVIEQGFEAWKALRVGLLTGTGICDILPLARGGYSKSRQDQLDEIVTEIFTGKPSGGFAATKYMREGIAKEPLAKMLYTELTGNLIDEVAFIRHDWMRVGMSPDGIIRGRKKNVEVKSPKDRTHLRYWLMETCPEEYVPQVQSQLWLGEFEECDFISYCPDFKDPRMQLKVITVQRDEAYIKKIEAEVSKFLAEVNIKVKDINKLLESMKG